MSEFDLDPAMESAAGFGWEAHFRQQPGMAHGELPGIRQMTTGGSCECTYACDPTSWPDNYPTCETCYTTCTGLTGRPCAC